MNMKVNKLHIALWFSVILAGCSSGENTSSESAKHISLNVKTEEVITCFNPRIIKTYGESSWCEEGCLSFPDKTVNVLRPNKIVVKYEDVDKKLHKKKLEGLASRVFQHEHDHMEGIDFTQRDQHK